MDDAEKETEKGREETSGIPPYYLAGLPLSDAPKATVSPGGLRPHASQGSDFP